MAITTRNDIFTKHAQGNGQVLPWIVASPSSGTSPVLANTGALHMALHANAIGTTYPGTLVSFPLPPSLPNELFTVGMSASSSTALGMYLAYFYKIGTVNLAVAGDQFTHDAATFPVTRTILGQAAQPVTLIPMIYLTTATVTTIPAFLLKTGAGGAGYVNQDGSNVVGTRTFTYPAAATAVQSGYPLRLELTDSGVRDITQINITTASGAGAATIYGVELLMPLGPVSTEHTSITDSVFGGLGMQNLKPASATTGTVTALLGIVNIAPSSTARVTDFILTTTLNSWTDYLTQFILIGGLTQLILPSLQDFQSAMFLQP